jgi:hypothetical protein
MNILKVIRLVLICMVLVICNNALAEELPLFIDLAPLNLEVIKTEVVDKISTSVLESRTLSAKEGNRLVIVTLKGNIPSPCKIMLWSTDFAAIVISEKMATTDDKGRNDSYLFSSSQQQSTAIALDSSFWDIPPSNKHLLMYHNFYNPGPITIKVAFILPATVDKFIVRYPSLARGKAMVLTEDNKN